jgi:hypothetical protein
MSRNASLVSRGKGQTGFLKQSKLFSRVLKVAMQAVFLGWVDRLGRCIPTNDSGKGNMMEE